ncbi:MAG: DNA mismatch repair endonuclease MutL [Flavobacteriales bacterium]|nr:DNA mismatch repair endonuclease MutL [Flavobacteriales bacterium]
MPDLIRLLPDSIANQIAAGEVVQRPASVVKELLENSLDAGATNIILTYRDGGQTFIEVIDNGLGMNETDARMAWERHATSKIEKAEDLFALHTFGFRGEALASIAAVAQVEMRTRQRHSDFGIELLIEASEIRRQGPVSCPEGTAIRVKNLFFNIPARRKFLKSVSVEGKHIIETFEKVALAYPDVSMSLYNGEQEVHRLSSGNLENRIRQLFGDTRSDSLIPLNEDTEIVGISGFVGAPGLSRKTRGEQYFYVNRRFIRNPYFQHAVQTAYEGLIDSDSFPLFVLFLEIDPSKVDVNVHPTKTEVKFEEAQAIYSILKSVVRRALGAYHHTPQMDELIGARIDFGNRNPSNAGYSPDVRVNTSFNPFERTQKDRVPTEWEKLYEPFRDREWEQLSKPPEKPTHGELFTTSHTLRESFQLDAQHAVCNLDGNLYIVQLQHAVERIVYEKYNQRVQPIASQQLLFPRTVEFSAGDFELICGLLEEINEMGFDISPFGRNTVIINGTPADIAKGNEQHMLEGILATYKSNMQELKLQKRENIARSLARNTSLKMESRLSSNELNELISELFQTSEPAYTPGGKPTFVMFDPNQLNTLFKK